MVTRDTAGLPVIADSQAFQDIADLADPGYQATAGLAGYQAGRGIAAFQALLATVDIPAPADGQVTAVIQVVGYPGTAVIQGLPDYQDIQVSQELADGVVTPATLAAAFRGIQVSLEYQVGLVIADIQGRQATPALVDCPVIVDSQEVGLVGIRVTAARPVIPVTVVLRVILDFRVYPVGQDIRGILEVGLVDTLGFPGHLDLADIQDSAAFQDGQDIVGIQDQDYQVIPGSVESAVGLVIVDTQALAVGRGIPDIVAFQGGVDTRAIQVAVYPDIADTPVCPGFQGIQASLDFQDILGSAGQDFQGIRDSPVCLVGLVSADSVA